MNIYLQPLWRGTLAQLVEQRTENPCVPGSIPGGTTKKSRNLGLRDFLFLISSALSARLKYKLNHKIAKKLLQTLKQYKNRTIRY